MSKIAYVTLVGRYPWAVVNSYYALLKKERCMPDRIMMICEESFNNYIDSLVSSIGILNKEFNVTAEIHEQLVSDASFADAGRHIVDIFKQLKKEDYDIALDITPARKAIVAAAVIAASKVDNVSNVFYLAVKGEGMKDMPYMMKPMNLQHIHDLLTDIPEANR